MKTNIALITKNKTQIPLFQVNTFDPSSIKIGSKLNIAKKKFICPASKKTVCKKSPLNKVDKIIKSNPKIKLVTGPAKEIIPFCLIETFSAKK